MPPKLVALICERLPGNTHRTDYLALPSAPSCSSTRFRNCFTTNAVADRRQRPASDKTLTSRRIDAWSLCRIKDEVVGGWSAIRKLRLSAGGRHLNLRRGECWARTLAESMGSGLTYPVRSDQLSQCV